MEQKFMRACKTSRGLQGGCVRNKYASHKMYCSLLNHFSFVYDVIGNKLQSVGNDKGNKAHRLSSELERKNN